MEKEIFKAGNITIKDPGYDLWVEVDAQSVIQLSQSPGGEGHLILLQDARWLLRHSVVKKISHVFRKGNNCANWVTKWVRQTHQSVELTENFPLELTNLRFADARGVRFERL